MNPRDEKIITIIHKKQRSDYENFVPFVVIQRSLPWTDGTELTIDLLNLSEQGYLCAKIFQQNILAFGMLLLLKEIVNMNAFSMTTLKRKRTEIYKF